jgi:hypothetical protein
MARGHLNEGRNQVLTRESAFFSAASSSAFCEKSFAEARIVVYFTRARFENIPQQHQDVGIAAALIACSRGAAGLTFISFDVIRFHARSMLFAKIAAEA